MMDRWFGEVQLQAAKQNSWEVVAVIEEDKTPGRLPGGTAVIRRGFAPTGVAGREWGSVRWSVEKSPRRVVFYAGRYDLTKDEAFADLIDRTVGIAVETEIERGSDVVAG